MMNKVYINNTIPKFRLADQNGNIFDSTSMLGSNNLVIYFYPKDDTPGCTAQACSFRDSYEIFKEYDAEVIGISSDDPEKHASFARKHRLPFILLSDVGDKIRNKFGVPKSIFGLLPGRVTYIVDKSGKVKHIFSSQFQIKKHINEAIEVLKNLN